MVPSSVRPAPLYVPGLTPRGSSQLAVQWGQGANPRPVATSFDAIALSSSHGHALDVPCVAGLATAQVISYCGLTQSVSTIYELELHGVPAAGDASAELLLPAPLGPALDLPQQPARGAVARAPPPPPPPPPP